MKENTNDRWNKVMKQIKATTTQLSYSTWFEPIVLLSINDDNSLINLEVPNSLVLKVINDRYLRLLKSSISEVFGKSYNISFSLPSSNPKPKTVVFREYEDEFYFNPRYTFDNFVVGDHNKYAHAAAVAVAESPSDAYNPLFIYGGSGLGKTHLMHAIGIHILKNHPELRVLYVSSEMFTSELIDAIRDTKNNKRKMDEFKNKYRNQDVLLIDDVQFIEGKEQTELELFNTFNTLYDNGKQIILSSDRAPNKLVNLDERLRSRFGWNIIADIQPPDFETRVAILQRKAHLDGIELSEDILDVINFIAEKIKMNVRDLESALSRVTSFSTMMNEPVTLRFAKNVLKDIISIQDNSINPEYIKKKVCRKFGLKISDMDSSKRTKNIAYPRQISMYLCRVLTDLSYPQIGKYFGGRDHTTVLHAFEKISNDIKNNSETNQIVSELINEIKED